ncbi:MAG: type II secretion system protein GspL [Gammaproteobacteria bacterium]|nr:type II secretion system protein GspL [Gammaproteobacteria bacterium]
MADTLLLHFSSEQADFATWSLVNSAGELSTMLSSGSLSDAAPLAAKHKTIVLLDSTRVHIDSVRLPIKKHQKLLRAAPFALEEKIADDVEDLHFVAGKTSSNGSTAIAAIDRSTLENILSRLNQHGIEPVAMIPDALCLTANTKQWAVLLHNGRTSVQFNTFDAGEFDRDATALILESALHQDGRQTPEKIILFTTDGDETDIQDIEKIIPENIELIKISYNKHPLVIYCGEYKHALDLNLLQGEYKPVTKSSVNWQRWRLAAALTIIFISLQIGITATRYQTLHNQNSRLQVEIDKIYKQAFPESTRIVNARVQMEQKLNELKGTGHADSSTSLITLLSEASPALSSEKDITIQAINYKASKLDIDITGSTLKNIEQLNKKLNNGNIKAEIISSSSEKDKVKGSIRLQKASQS